ncbi:MAG: helix-turn-helix transcriptional regulator [Thermoanaerobaculia bacterium]|nr:helix-turn-helix transcriptional regulator [Thermoanaerobaculia bacterium]
MPEEIQNPQGFLPLTPAMFHVLVALADADKHGYQIMKETEERTGGEVALSAGTLYGLIKRLLEGGLIVEPRRLRIGEDERRRTYQLTELGRRVVIAEAERLERSVALARAKRLLEPEVAR